MSAQDPLATLFRKHRTLRSVIDCVLERRLGTITADDPNRPRVARLELGCYAIFGGDAGHTEAERLVRSVGPPRELLIPDDQSWRDLLSAVHGLQLDDRPMRTFELHALDRTRLERLAAGIPSDFRVERLDRNSASQLDASIQPHAMQVFADVGDFLEHGLGYGVLEGDRLASAATSYAISAVRVEVAIATRSEYRGRGLAKAVAARMLTHCLESGLRPEWSAANPVSKRLALALGYRPGPLCDVFYLDVASSGS
jgi:GNAT superfamily N-acetyltransferase